MEHRAYLMRLKKENIWKDVVEGLKSAGFTRMLIFQYGQDIILFEEAENLQESYTFLDKDKKSAKWDAMIAEWMEAYYPEWNEIKQDIEFQEIPVVFYFDEGLLKH